ncbi:MAG TPA: class I SAM-dependent rRNA methyltransferase [Casimicrobiaceae bacterium]|nr:class I SAM-dependent rRNA methyltransferase [Casimicrobiaceae bacterium]
MAQRHRGETLVRLKPAREKSLRHHHPWLFSGAIQSVDDSPGVGDTVAIVSDDGAFLARAAYSPASQIRARVWSFDPEEMIDAAFFTRRVQQAVQARSSMLDSRHTACRLIHGEADGLPGVIADRYGEVIVLQLSSAGAERWRDAIVAALVDATRAACVYERSDLEVRALEGLPLRAGPLLGNAPEDVVMIEDGLRYRVDVVAGQKTGFFLDQRDNRAAIRAVAANRRVLNMFCYTGGFTLAALAGGAREVLSVDSSAEALSLARENVVRNPELPQDRAQWREADAFGELRRLRDAGASFDLIVLDPPKFAPTAHHVERAARAYKDINLLALKMLRRDGLLATFSCSGGVDALLFRKIVAGAAADARADAVIERSLSASRDHPVSIAFPEGEYLKGLLLRRTA